MKSSKRTSAGKPKKVNEICRMTKMVDHRVGKRK